MKRIQVLIVSNIWVSRGDNMTMHVFMLLFSLLAKVDRQRTSAESQISGKNMLAIPTNKKRMCEGLHS